ncbi:iron-siderophore ABC transporter substrate-binding protein [Micrococcales bacterium 31B]|nr:iron-siderophore ABC transporter substrate-binding protein [Micrococcales bacterium 31B]
MSSLSRRSALAALALSAVTGLAACAETAPAESATNNSADATPATPAPGATGQASPAASGQYRTPRDMPEGKGSGQADGVFPRDVVHFAGTTTVPSAPQRVVVINTGQADGLLLLGLAPVGSTSAEGAQIVPQYLLDAYAAEHPGLAATPDVGLRSEPKLEAIAALKPDLIMMNTSGDGATDLYDTFSRIAPTIAAQGTGLYWKQDFQLMADALGKLEQAQAWLTEYHADAAGLGTSLTTPASVSFVRKNADRLRVFGVPSFAGSVAEDAGLQRPASQQFDKTSQDISPESLDLADADYIFYGVQGEPSEITGMPLWGSLQGTKVQVDDDAFYLNTGPTAARVVLAQLRETLGTA